MSTNTLNLTYKSTIAIPFGKLQQIIDWCNRNCSKEWAYTDASGLPEWLQDIHKYIESPAEYTFMFEDEKDYVAFVLVYR
jgi:hypothetical protein